MERLICLLFLLMFLGALSETPAGELASPLGFVVTYPDGWNPATKEQRDWFAEQMGKRMAGSSFELLVGTRRDGYPDNMSIAVLPQTFPIDAEGEKTISGGLKKGLGEKASSLKSKRLEINGKSALTIAMENDRQIPGDTVRVWLVFLPGKERTYVFTCTTLKSRWDETWPVFKKMVYSARIDVPQ